MTTKISANVLASGAALTNINAGSTIDFTKNVSMSGNLTVDTNTFFVDSVNNRVGIGTATPAASLSIKSLGSDSTTDALLVQYSSGTGTLIRGRDDGRVFIGSGTSVNSNAVLNVQGEIFGTSNLVVNGTLFAGTNGFAAKAGLDLRLSTYTSGKYVYITNDWATNSVPVSFGIGTTTPNERLTVVGNISATGNISASGTVTGTNLVYNTGDQTIAGAKTFSNDTVINGGLTINSTTRGIYIPRLTTVQRDALSTPSDGLMIYESTRSNIQTYNSTLASWQNAVNSSSIRTMVSLTRSDYNALSSKDSETFYIITDDPVSSPTVYPLYSTSVDYSITDADTVILVTANSPTITLPSSTSLTGRVYYIKNRSTLSCTLSTTASESIDGLSSIPIAPNNSIQTISTGSGWIIL